MNVSVYSFQATTLEGKEISLGTYRGRVLLIVNTASDCGFTPQYAELQELYDRNKDQGFTVLGFPCNQFGGQEPGTDAAIAEFCSIRYGVTFPMFSKIEVNGNSAHPLFVHLTERARGILGTKRIKWNFTKFLVDSQGQVLKRYAPNVSPQAIQRDIDKLLGSTAK